MDDEIDSASRAMIQGLRAALSAHREKRFFDVGNGWDDVAALDHDDERLSVALRFWEAWSDSAAHSWGYYEGISEGDWPRLAIALISSLERGQELETEVVERFAFN